MSSKISSINRFVFRSLLFLNLLAYTSPSQAGGFSNACEAAFELPKNETDLHEAPEILVKDEFNRSRSFGYYLGAFDGKFGLRSFLTERLGRTWQDRLQGLLRPMPVLPKMRWLDLGAGDAVAQRQMYLWPPKDFRKLDVSKIESVALAYKESEDHDLPADRHEIALKYGPKAFTEIRGKLFSDVPKVKLGSFDIITDIFGVLSYTKNFSQDLTKAISILKEGGRLYVELSPAYNKFIDSKTGAEIRLVEYLSRIRGLRIVEVKAHGMFNSWEMMSFALIRTGEDFVVPKTKLLEYISDAPAERKFLVE